MTGGGLGRGYSGAVGSLLGAVCREGLSDLGGRSGLGLSLGLLGCGGSCDLA